MRNPQLAPALTKALRARPERPGERRVVLLGVGSELRGDDAAGVRVAERMADLALPGVWALSAGPAPENLTGEVRRISPSHLIIVDAADMGEAPGTIRVVGLQEISGMSFGTHALPLSVLAGYLANETGCMITVMGIQPLSLEFDAGLSPEVGRAVDEAVQALCQCLGKPDNPR
jgi:hydrogenase 3 maturation protease